MCYDLRYPEGYNKAKVGFRREESKSESQQARVVTSNSSCIDKIEHSEGLSKRRAVLLYIQSSVVAHCSRVE